MRILGLRGNTPAGGNLRPAFQGITHAPGHMFVSDLKDEDLTIL